MNYLIAVSAFSAACALLAGGPRAAAAQAPLSLREALARADSAAYPNRMARAQLDRAAAGRGATLGGIVPSVRLEGGYTRSTDPLVAFGFQLRQRAVTTASFNPDLLNNPASRGDLQTGVAAEVPLVNLDAWAARSAAGHAEAADRARADWARRSVHLGVIEAWTSAVVAQERVRTLVAAEDAARAHVRQAERLAAQGLVTRSDVLLASVRGGEVETQRAAAEGERAIALRRLALAVGTPRDTSLRVPDSLPGMGAGSATGLEDSLRSDVQAARLSRDAADAGVERAGRAMLPRLNAFGRYDWHDPSKPFGGRGMWTAGVQVSWSPFTSARDVAARQAARADASAARDAVELAEATAALDLAEARIRSDVAARTLVIAERGVAQSAEAHRIVGRKYDGGLVTISELLDAAALETASRLGLARARLDVVVAEGNLRRASGQDLTALAVALDEGGTAR